MPLKRKLSLWEVTLCGIGLILGAGIYVLIGEGAAFSQNAVWLSFLAGAVIATLSGLSYAELASMYPKAGAEYDYSMQAFGKRAAFITGWLAIFASILGATTVAIGFGKYFGEFFALPWLAGAILIIAISALVLLLGVQQSARLGAIITLIEAAGLVFIVFIGIPFLGNLEFMEFPPAGGVLSGAVIVFFAFLGFEEVVRFSEETKNARTTIPKALILSIVASTVLYVLVAIAAVSIVGWEALAQSNSPLALVAESVAGNNAFTALAVIALFSTANTVLLVMLAASRLLYGISEVHVLPSALHRTWKNGVPWIAVLATAVLALLFIALGEIGFVASTVDFALFLIFIIINFSVIKLRFSEPEAERPFRVPLSIGRMPVLPVLGILSTLVLTASVKPEVMLVGAAVTGIGAAIALLFER